MIQKKSISKSMNAFLINTATVEKTLACVERSTSAAFSLVNSVCPVAVNTVQDNAAHFEKYMLTQRQSTARW